MKFDIELMIFIKILAIEVVYNILLTIILYPIMQKFRIQDGRYIQKSANSYKILLKLKE